MIGVNFLGLKTVSDCQNRYSYCIELQEMEEQDTVSTVQCTYGSGDTASRDCPRYIGGTRQGTGDKSYKI